MACAAGSSWRRRRRRKVLEGRKVKPHAAQMSKAAWVSPDDDEDEVHEEECVYAPRRAFAHSTNCYAVRNQRRRWRNGKVGEVEVQG